MISDEHPLKKNLDALEECAASLKQKRRQSTVDDLAQFYTLMGYTVQKRGNKTAISGKRPDDTPYTYVLHNPHGKKAGSRYLLPVYVSAAINEFNRLKLFLKAEEGVDIL